MRKLEGTIGPFWFDFWYHSSACSRWISLILSVMFYMYLNRDWLLPGQALAGVVSVLALGIFNIAVFVRFC